MHASRLMIALLAAAIAGCGDARPSPSSIDAADTADTADVVEATGTIEGATSYPSDHRPDLDVYAIDVSDDEHWYKVTVAGSDAGPAHDPEGSYSLDVAPGTYLVLAFLTDRSIDLAGLHSEAVPCGLTAACMDHRMRPVTVTAGETVSGIDTTDWYYPMEQQYPAPPD
jgi:hypothetical protein